MAPFKIIFIGCQLVYIMGAITQSPNFIFVQNLPAIPTLMIARIIVTLRQAKLIIDLHNFGYSVLGIKLGMDSKVVQLAKRYEQYFGKRPYAHLTVTDRMHRELVDWGVSGRVITYKDQRPYHFTRLSDDKILEHQIFLGSDSSFSASRFRSEIKLIVSATSWTEDEDFSILLQVIEKYENNTRVTPNSPKLLFVVTGKGPLKNLGISLHTSTSGMDLPMKVVDMFGCGLPVCAASFEWKNY
ncbi:hypothetical protein BDC45DRAFT_546785 [Circinella umbellata]|nr:hypothetical protein BDC45DRAFT_546785 [Circinella umbellata]